MIFFKFKTANSNFNIKYFGVFVLQLIFILSCTSPKFTFEQEGVKEINFSQGKWIFNRPVTYGIDDDLYNHSLKKWRVLIGDSLFLLNELRQNKLISENIEFDLNSNDLENIRLGTNCDYIINTKIRILNQELSALSSPRPPINTGTTERSNEAEVQVRIYSLKEKKLISSRIALGIIKEEARTDVSSGISMAMTSKGIGINGIDRIIDFYKKNRHD